MMPDLDVIHQVDEVCDWSVEKLTRLIVELEKLIDEKIAATEERRGSPELRRGFLTKRGGILRSGRKQPGGRVVSNDDLEQRLESWLADAPPEFVVWLGGVAVGRFLAHEVRVNFQMPGAYDGAMSEECKAICRKNETVARCLIGRRLNDA